jgi:hypothetical protein
MSSAAATVDKPVDIKKAPATLAKPVLMMSSLRFVLRKRPVPKRIPVQRLNGLNAMSIIMASGITPAI